MNAWPTLLFSTYFLTQWIIAILSKGCKPDNFEPHNSLKLSFTNIIGLSSNFVQCEYFLESNSPDILTLCETNLDDSIDSGSFSVRGYLALIWKVPITYIYGIAVYVKEGLPFAWASSSETLRVDSYLCFELALFHLVSITFFSIMHSFWFYFTPNIDEVFSISPSAVFVFGDFNVHHKDWLTYYGGNDRLVNSGKIFLSQTTFLR